MAMTANRELTFREEQVAALLRYGYGRREIADRLGCSELTVTTHIRHMMLKLGATTQVQLGAQLERRLLLAAVPDGTMLLEPRELYDRCLVGAAHRAGEIVAVYSRTRVIEALVAEGASYDDAVDHYEFNVSGGLGWGFPVFMLDEEDPDA